VDSARPAAMPDHHSDIAGRDSSSSPSPLIVWKTVTAARRRCSSASSCLASSSLAPGIAVYADSSCAASGLAWAAGLIVKRSSSGAAA